MCDIASLNITSAASSVCFMSLLMETALLVVMATVQRSTRRLCNRAVRLVPRTAGGPIGT